MKKIELIQPDNTLAELKERLSLLNDALSLIKKRISGASSTVSDCSLRVAHNKNSPQFYLHHTDSTKKDIYIPKNNTNLICQLAQKSYDEKLIPVLEKEISLITNFINAREQIELSKSSLFTKSKDRMPFISPVTQTEADYKRLWLEVPYTPKKIPETQKTYRTARGEIVRSKSEVIIADTLFRNNIPYRYEFPVKLKIFSDGVVPEQSGIGNSQSFYPDFYCLNTRTHQEFIWEHFGMMSEPDYSNKATAKINNYILNGWLPGENLITTFESDDVPLSTAAIEKLIKNFLC